MAHYFSIKRTSFSITRKIILILAVAPLATCLISVKRARKPGIKIRDVNYEC